MENCRNSTRAVNVRISFIKKESLVKLNIPVPACKGTFVCSKCTTQCNHKEFTKTCASDNLLTILMLYCQRHPAFLLHSGSGDLEATLKASISLMNTSNITEGKSFMLKKAHDRLNLTETRKES